MNSFYILDVFAEEKYAGNQLAVVRVNPAPLSDIKPDDFSRLCSGKWCGVKKRLSKLEMQKIAKEINFSETTFILSDVPQKRGYDVRIFTPRKEIP